MKGTPIGQIESQEILLNSRNAFFVIQLFNVISVAREFRPRVSGIYGASKISSLSGLGLKKCLTRPTR